MLEEPVTFSEGAIDPSPRSLVTLAESEPPSSTGELTPQPPVRSERFTALLTSHTERLARLAGLPPTAQPQSEPADAERAAQPRVQLAGRLGQNPTLRTTPKGTLVARFPLGVRDEQDLEKTIWHTVLAFKQRAEQVRDQLKKGDAAEVIGYLHTREILRRDGSSRTIQEVYATVVKPR